VADAIAGALVTIAGFSGASVEVSPKGQPDHLEAASSGAPKGREAAHVIELSGHLAGSIRLQARDGGDASDAQTLIDLLAPTIALALDNAFGYRALSDHQKNLERIVEQRTIELRSTSAKLAGTVAQLTDAQGVRERFFGNISHEIRTPLSIVLLAVADIEKRSNAALDPRARTALGSITDSARKLVRLVDELLLLAAGQEGKLRIKAEPTNLSAMLASLIGAWTPATEDAGLTLTCRAPDQLFANVDPVAIERVATNLVSNAVKYTPGPGSIEIELAVDAAHLRLSVFDTGDGISDELAARMFGRFERADKDSHIVGTGIGLSIVKQLVEGHGGTVAAHRRPTGGTELRVELPGEVVITGSVHHAVIPIVAPAAAAVVPKPVGQLSAPDALASGSILLAEDDVRLADMIGELLGEDYVVRIANDGATALDIARRYQPQLLITDVDMPGMDGIELSRRFREVTNDRLAPVIILSAVLDLGTRVAGLEAGAVDYVTKPFDPSELKARVRAQFRMRDLAMRLHRAEQLSTLGVLTSGLAHELRNPANGVVNAVEPLRQLLPPELLVGDHPVGQLLDVIGECAEQINMLARQLLGFRNSATELQVRPTKLHELVQRALSIGQEAYKDVVVRVRIPADVTVECAPPLMIQVLTNLLENAAHAAGRGGWIEVIARSDGTLVSLEIADSGPGVPIELRGKVFEPFFTTKMQGTGTGLGLAVSREIVARHHGTLEIEDQGAHSVFVVRIPRRAA
jgi:signal transduction histidine kinase